MEAITVPQEAISILDYRVRTSLSFSTRGVYALGMSGRHNVRFSIAFDVMYRLACGV